MDHGIIEQMKHTVVNTKRKSKSCDRYWVLVEYHNQNFEAH
jgi:hypothetical protein